MENRPWLSVSSVVGVGAALLGLRMAEENRAAIESLAMAFEALAVNARAKRWPSEAAADAAFRLGCP
jgi:hypothetical protein